MGEQTYAMCAAARRELGPWLMQDCERSGHRCDGPRTPVWFECWVVDDDGTMIQFYSRHAHCGSCQSDHDFGYDSDLDYCCCIHRQEQEQAAA